MLEPVLTDEQTAAVRQLAEDPEGVFWQVEATLKEWLAFKHERLAATDAWRSELPPHQRDVIGKLDLSVLQCMLLQSRHEDVQFVRDLLRGFPVTGELGIGGLGVDIPGEMLSRGRRAVQGPMPLETLRARCRELNEVTLHRAAGRRPRSELELVAGCT